MEELYDTIERYLNDELSEQERRDFEVRLAGDADLRKEVDLVREMKDHLSAAFRHQQQNESLKVSLQTIGNEYFKAEHAQETQPKIVPITQRWWLLAAALALAIAVIFLLRPKPDLYEQYAVLPNAAFTVKGALPTAAMSEAELFFNQKKYAAALGAIEQWLTASPTDQEAIFYKGLCLLEISKLSEAATVFQSLASTDSAYSEDARWFLALTFLKQKNFPACRDQLRNISSESAYFQKANSLSKELPSK